MATAGDQAESAGAGRLPDTSRAAAPSGHLGGASFTQPSFNPLLDDNNVRAPIPSRRDQLYDAAYHLGDPHNRRSYGRGQQEGHNIDAFRDFKSEQAGRADSDGAPADSPAPSAAPSAGGGGLADLFKAPDNVFKGTFEAAKMTATKQNRWLLANVQSNAQFASHQLNRDTWSHATVKDIVQGCFVFWQAGDASDQGSKIMGFYHLHELPAVMVIDPVTGAKMKEWKGFVDPDRMLEGLMPFLERNVTEAAHLHKRNRPVSRPSSTPDPRKTSKPEAAPMTEDEELATALAASAAETASGPGESSGRPESASAPPSTVPQQALFTRKPAGAAAPSADAEPMQQGQTSPVAAQSQVAGPSGLGFVPKSKEALEADVPAEPVDNDSSAVRVAVRSSAGRYMRKFPGGATVKALYSWCTLQNEEAMKGHPFVLAHSGPGGQELKDQDVSLVDAQVNGSMLMMRIVN